MTPQEVIHRATLWKRANAGEGVLQCRELAGGGWIDDLIPETSITDDTLELRLVNPPPAPAPRSCPLCGSSLRIEEGTDDTWYHGADGSCHLFGIRITPRTLAAWNRRAPCPECAAARAEAETRKDIAARAVERMQTAEASLTTLTRERDDWKQQSRNEAKLRHEVEASRNAQEQRTAAAEAKLAAVTAERDLARQRYDELAAAYDADSRQAHPCPKCARMPALAKDRDEWKASALAATDVIRITAAERDALAKRNAEAVRMLRTLNSQATSITLADVCATLEARP